MRGKLYKVSGYVLQDVDEGIKSMLQYTEKESPEFEYDETTFPSGQTFKPEDLDKYFK